MITFPARSASHSDAGGPLQSLRPISPGMRIKDMITKKFLLVALLAMGFIFPAAIRAQNFTIEIGDRPYYNHGAHYWDNDWEMTWAPGHWSEHGHHWIHGHYVKGQHRHHNDHHNDHHDDHHDDHREH
jgi:hypothetical protein